MFIYLDKHACKAYKLLNDSDNIGKMIYNVLHEAKGMGCTDFELRQKVLAQVELSRGNMQEAREALKPQGLKEMMKDMNKREITKNVTGS